MKMLVTILTYVQIIASGLAGLAGFGLATNGFVKLVNKGRKKP